MKRLFSYSFVVLLGLVFVTPISPSWSAGMLKVTTPDGGQKWKTGKKYAIKWVKGNAGGTVKIQLLKSNKHYKWVSKKTKNDGKHPWRVPSTVKTSSAYKIKITSTKNKKIFDKSNKNFTITNRGSGMLKVTTPNGGESWTTGKSYTVKWKKRKAGSYVKIELLKSGKQYKWIAKKTKNDGKHVWKIPSTVESGSTYKVKIINTLRSSNKVTDTSNKNFTINKASSTETCTMWFRIGDPESDLFYPGKKICLGKTPTDVVCATTGGAGPSYWAKIQKVPKENLNIYFCGSSTPYRYGVSPWYCYPIDNDTGGGFEFFPAQCF